MTPTGAAEPNRPVLVIHDDAVIGRSYCSTLLASGVSSILATSDPDGFARFRTAPEPNIIVLDFTRPGRSSGILDLLKSDPRKPAIIAVMLASVVPRARLVAWGVDACVDRSRIEVDLGRLVRRIRQEKASESESSPSGIVRVRVASWQEYGSLYEKEIQRGGLFVYTSEPYPVTDEVSLRIELPDGRLVSIAAEVKSVVSVARGSSSGKRPGMGLRFLELSDELRETLAPPAGTITLAPPAALPPTSRPARSSPPAAGPRTPRTPRLPGSRSLTPPPLGDDAGAQTTVRLPSTQAPPPLDPGEAPLVLEPRHPLRGRSTSAPPRGVSVSAPPRAASVSAPPRAASGPPSERQRGSSNRPAPRGRKRTSPAFFAIREAPGTLRSELPPQVSRLAERPEADASSAAPAVTVPRAARVPSAVSPASAASQDRRAALSAALRSYLKEINSRDYYSALGLRRGEGRDAIRAAFHARIKRLHPTRFALEPDEVRETVTEIFLLLKQIHDTLSDPESGARYNARLERPSGPPLDDSSVIAIEQLRKRGPSLGQAGARALGGGR